MSSRPKVSVVTICYNQEKYIRQALESFVMQKTDFPFEVIIADDCSTDKTPDIIRKFAKSHPDIFKPILREKNVGAIANSISALQAASGKYIALCEGDDYWTDPKKLQKQADFLDKHRSYALCFHPVRVFFENKEEKDSIYPDSQEKERFVVGELLSWNFIQTNSVMYRRQNYDHMPNDILPLDWYLHLYHAQFGKIGFIDEVMSAYRRHPGGLWWESYANKDALWKKYGIVHLRTYGEFLKLYGKDPAYAKRIHQSMFNVLQAFIDTKNEKLLVDVMELYPDILKKFIVSEHRQLQRKTVLADASQQKVAELHELIQQKDKLMQKVFVEQVETKEQLAEIKSSRLWKTYNQIAKLVRRKVI